MTEPQPHCGHECVCISFDSNPTYPKSEKPCSSIDCEHDTRTHTATERLCDDCNIIELEERLINLEQELKDARKDEREKVLDAIEKWSDNEVYGVDDEGYDATPVVPYLGLEHQIKSLRRGGA